MFTYKMPTELFVGRGAAAELGNKVRELGCSRVLIVTDNGLAGSGVIRKLEDSLKAAKLPYTVFDEVEPEPTIQGVAKATKQAKDFKADVVVGVGGGSPMDSAKAVAVMATNPGKIFDYVGFGLVKMQPLPIIAVPTTAGTGSEATFWSVLCDKTKNIKASVGGWNLMPTLAVVDAELTVGLPPRITAATGMDALCHAMESYVAKSTQPISEGLSLAAMKLIARSLRKAVNRGDDLQAREDMIMGSLIAALAFNITRLGNAHALAIPFGANFGIPP
ncbi:MAG: iron-containing alcohol dehydrogenase [Deltaproteobacteria bacterium]|nr:iron-containing alcohol dehydrogenase [Deltaproteobacteria bacterium]